MGNMSNDETHGLIVADLRGIAESRDWSAHGRQSNRERLEHVADRLDAEYMREAHEIERIVRDAIVSYAELYMNAPNDECEKEILERAEVAQKWLESHGFSREKVSFDRNVEECVC